MEDLGSTLDLANIRTAGVDLLSSLRMKRQGQRDATFGWVFYDFGNSAFPTVVVGALLPVYFEEHVMGGGSVSFLGGQWTSESLWSLIAGFGPLLILVLMPVLGAIADRSRLKGRMLSTFTYACCLTTVALFLAGEGDVVYTLAVFLAALVLFAGANVFYNGFLTDVSTPETIHRVSSRGVAFGYLGGGLHLILALGLVAVLSEPLGSRIAIASAGVWFAVFASVALRHLRDANDMVGADAGAPVVDRIRSGLSKNLATLRRVRRFPEMTRFFVAYLLYSNGMQTVVALTAVYAAQTLRLDQTTIIVAFLIVQVVSIPAAYGAGRATTRLGAKRTLGVILVVWVAVVTGAYALPAGAVLPFYGLAVLVGLVLAPAEALSRSIFGSIIPEDSSTEFFGFYALSARFASIWGPLVFAWTRQSTGSGRTAILTIAAFILAGLVLFSRFDLETARARRHEWTVPIS